MSGYYNRNNRGITKKLGPVTAYADAVLAGYKGTREQWAQDMAKLGQNVTQVAQNTELTTELAKQTRENTEQVAKDTADVRRLADETSDNAVQVASNTAESNRLAKETKQAAAQAKADAEYAGAAADNFRVDTTLSEEGKAAEAKTVGEKFAQLSEDIVDTRNTSAWWKEGDSVYNSILPEDRKALSMIADISVKSHVKGSQFQVYGIVLDESGNWSIKIRKLATKNCPETSTTITLTASETYTKAEFEYSTFVGSFYYRTDGKTSYRCTQDTDYITLRNIEYTQNPLTDGYADIDSRLFPKCVVNPNVTAITVLRTQNVDKTASGSSYDYFAQYQATYRNGTTETFTAKSGAGVKTGIIVDGFDDFAVYVDADALAMHSTRMVGLNIPLNLVYADHTEIKGKSFKNNLTTDGVKSLPNCNIYKNKVASDDNYGDDNVRYHFLLPTFRKLHLYFDYQFTKPLKGVTDDTNIQMFSVGKYAITGTIIRQTAMCSKGYVFQNAAVGQNCSGVGVGSMAYAPPNNKPLNGENAFWIRFKGDVSAANKDIVLSVTPTEFTVKHSATGAVLETFTYTSEDSVDALISKIGDSNHLECGFVSCSGHTCGELLIPDVDVPLVYELAKSDNTTHVDAPRVHIPYATDSTWHSVEAVIDLDAQKSYVAYDGLTHESDFLAEKITAYDLNIGGGQYNASETPIRIRNLVVDIDTFGDAEIVKSVAPPYSERTQLISGHNPKLLIYEGHGVDVRKDADGIGSDEMAISTDRLNVLFESLTTKGYIPVTWKEVIDWKVNRKPLPKRCFVTMFDDYYFSNYVDYDKRTPFEKYNVKAGLAIASDSKDLSDTLEINGKTYTISEIVDMVMKSGWYPCSHTTNHRLMIDDKPSELPELLKHDALSCNNLGIYSDIIVYPQGLMDIRCLSALEESAFKLGVNIVCDRYNCSATHDLNLTRVELGTRNTLADVLATIV